MKYSLNWIREFARFPSGAALTMNLITTRTAECEGIESYGVESASVATVVSAEPVPGTKLMLAHVETERYGHRVVVCGAPNCRAGLRTAYLPIGLKTIQGIESDGMLAGTDELGINRDHEGIVELNEAEPNAAEPHAALPSPDYILEIDNKSLTHRPDLWGHFGMAREVAAITGGELRDPVNLSLLPGGAPAVEVEGMPGLCPRFSALVYENVRVGPSPLWLQFRLTSLGLNPISNLVDLTNYVAAELAQPMHAYDRDLLHGNKLTARPAREGETIVALNQETYALSPANLVIADDRGPVSIAGVIGGQESAIHAGTRSVVFEAANFQAASVRKTSSALRIRTDASMRFEKSQDAENTVRALARTVELMEQLCPEATLVGGLADWRAESQKAPAIALDGNWLNRKLGRTVDAGQVRGILESLGFGISGEWPGFSVTVPSWRATKDVGTPDDLVEEVGRMVGYETIPPVAPAVLSTVPPDTAERLYLRRVRAMAASQGFTEVYNYSFLSEQQAEQFGFAPKDLVRVLNPIAQNQGLLRPSLLPGVYANLVENRKHLGRFRLFEIGREIHKRPEPALPDEEQHLMLAIYGEEGALLELKRLSLCLAEGIEVHPAEARAFEHPRRTGDVMAGNSCVGRLFELHPDLLEGRASILDLNLRSLERFERKNAAYPAPKKYPSSGFDLSVIAAPREPVGHLMRRMQVLGGPLVEHITYVGQYARSDTKSVTFRFTVYAEGRTLSSSEVTQVRSTIIDGMRGLGYDLTV